MQPDAEGVVIARREVVRAVRQWRVPLSGELLDDLELLSGEVIANAVRHAGADCSVVARWTGERVRVEVADGSDARPEVRREAVDEEGGRGLVLVEALAAAWGCVVEDAGKVVWFEVGARRQPAPWSMPGTWTITTTDGRAAGGYLPEWAEDDPSETGVPPEELNRRLALVSHRTFFEGPLLPVTAPDLWDGPEDEPVFEGSIDCNPHDADPRLRVPVVNLRIAEGRWVLGLDPDALGRVADRLREHADFLDRTVRVDLRAARDGWKAHGAPARTAGPVTPRRPR